MSDRGIRIVTRGWDLGGWGGAFYPDDLPPEWRLTYYANAFPAVLVSASDWLRPGASSLRARADDVHDEFRFFLEVPSALPPLALSDAERALGPKLAGIVGGTADVRRSATPFYRWVSSPGEASAPGCALACPVPAAVLDLRAARTWLETFHESLGGSPGLVVLDGDAVSPETFRRWLELAWLMGVA